MDRLAKFLAHHQHEDGALPIVLHGGDAGVVSDSHGYLLTLDDLRALTAKLAD